MRGILPVSGTQCTRVFAWPGQCCAMATFAKLNDVFPTRGAQGLCRRYLVLFQIKNDGDSEYD